MSMSLLLLSLVAIPSPHVMLISLPLCYSVDTIRVHTQNNCFNTFLNEFSRVRNCTFGGGNMRYLTPETKIAPSPAREK